MQGKDFSGYKFTVESFIKNKVKLYQGKKSKQENKRLVFTS